MSGKILGLYRAQSSIICSNWNRSDTLVATGGDETNIIVWKPNTISKDPLYQFDQPGQIIDIAWQDDRKLAAASQSEIYLWSIDQKQPVRIWQGHQSPIESIKWDPKFHLLASSAQDDTEILIWSPKSNQPVFCLNDHEGPIRDFKWSNIDQNQTNLNAPGVGFIVTLSMDRNVKVYDIAKNKPQCLMTLKHEQPIISLSLSPDNQLLAVGGQNSDIYIWSLKDQNMLRSFYNPTLNGIAELQ